MAEYQLLRLHACLSWQQCYDRDAIAALIAMLPAGSDSPVTSALQCGTAAAAKWCADIRLCF